MKKKLTGIYMEIFFEELKEAVGHDIDLVELETLFDSQDKPERKALLENILKERVKVFER